MTKNLQKNPEHHQNLINSSWAKPSSPINSSKKLSESVHNSVTAWADPTTLSYLRYSAGLQVYRNDFGTPQRVKPTATFRFRDKNMKESEAFSNWKQPGRQTRASNNVNNSLI